MLDLAPATQQLTGLLAGLSDDQLTARTPCERYTLGDLVEHVDGLSLAFTLAAKKQQPPEGARGPSGDASRLDPDWRAQLPVQLAELAEAWRDPQAWDGMTQVGGIELPGQVTGLVGLNELLVHSWDISRASGQPFAADPADIQACSQFLAGSADDRGGDSPFGPVIEVPAGALALDRLIGLSGRNPGWTPPG